MADREPRDTQNREKQTRKKQLDLLNGLDLKKRV